MEMCRGCTGHQLRHGVSLLIVALVTTGLVWGCAGRQGAQESTAMPILLTFEREIELRAVV